MGIVAIGLVFVAGTPCGSCSKAVGLGNNQSSYLKTSIMAQINPYIHFNGNAEEAFTFYKSVFGGEFATVTRFKDMGFENLPIGEEEANNLMHIALPIGNNSMLMGSDTPSFMGKHNEQENRSKISIMAESKEEADQLFNGLSAGGQVEMAMADSPWGSYFGMFRDKYGIEWMINYDQQPR
ncbi:PhnB protein [Lacibacter cauensis]|uniref:PhnB protein n=2 Tax=Lacibacter cauensis TaxID=510947 RepID=A0A562SI00_9BACT|nr:PhnB protein [Lacibacter cauensis]